MPAWVDLGGAAPQNIIIDSVPGRPAIWGFRLSLVEVCSQITGRLTVYTDVTPIEAIMRILFLTQIIPYPPVAGPKIKTWHVLRHLAASGHDVILASFLRPEEEEYLPAVKQVCSQVYTVPIRRSKWIDGLSWLRSHLTGRPFLVERDDLPAMRALVKRCLEEQAIDAIHADQFSMPQFALPSPLPFSKFSLIPSFDRAGSSSTRRPMRVFDAHNATWSIVDRMVDTYSGVRALLKPVIRIEARRVKRYEGMVLRNFDHTLAVTEVDKCALVEAMQAYDSSVESPTVGMGSMKSNHEPRITVVPIAVDTEQRLPVQRRPGSTNILTLGTLFYPPNADGIRWFAQEVFPLVLEKNSAATLTIIGKNPPQDFIQMAERQPQSIRVTGYVPDLIPYLKQAALAVVPVRAGSGMRVRILEMFAHAMPVVTTTVGLEGIDAQHGKEVLVADTPQELASAVLRLIQDPSLQADLARNGRRLAVEKYDWKVALRKLTDIYTPGGGSC